MKRHLNTVRTLVYVLYDVYSSCVCNESESQVSLLVMCVCIIGVLLGSRHYLRFQT